MLLKDSKILIIDDELLNIELLGDLLEGEGYNRIYGETNPFKALELYEQQDFDIILLDINMPELDGFDVLNRLAKIIKPTPPSPVLVITALHDQKVCNCALKMGATDFIYKPFNADEALNRISNILNKRDLEKYTLEINDKLEEMVHERTKELEKTKLKIIQHLGFAAEYRDTETAAHTIRVGEYAKILAHQARLDKHFVDLLQLAAPLHDIGKIGIADAILLKPGRFEPDEWKIMQTHAQIGADILDNDDDPLIVLARSIALTHHEKFDGSGYPNGLKGQNIPIEGRIVMIADVFDALTMVRPYKKAWPIDDAIGLIKKESGTSFDPVLVDLFLLSIDKFIKVRKEYKD